MSSGPEGIELCDSVGLKLDPWQSLWITHGLGETASGDWASFEVGGLVARQNGKGEVLMARTVIGIHLLGEELISHTAHEFKTAREAFRRLKTLYLNCPELMDTVSKIVNSHGEEGIEFKSGQRVLFLARSKSSGRGFTGDCVIMDEAQILTDDPIDAMLPMMSTRRHPQVWYAGTAGKPDSYHFGRVRQRGIAGDDSLTYLEWSADENEYDMDDPHDWAKANPAMGIRIRPDYIRKERAAMSDAGFARERMSIGEWPISGGAWVIPEAKWNACDDGNHDQPAGEVVFAVDVNPIRTVGSIAVSGYRPDGGLAVEIAEQDSGTDWILGRAKELEGRWRPWGWVIDRSGPAGTLVDDFKNAGLYVIDAAGQELAQASADFYDRAVNTQLRHTSDSRLSTAIAGAVQQPVGDAWRWGRRKSTSEICPLVAASLAVWGFETQCGAGLGPGDITVA